MLYRASISAGDPLVPDPAADGSSPYHAGAGNLCGFVIASATTVADRITRADPAVGDVAPCVDVERIARRPVANLNAPSAKSAARPGLRSGCITKVLSCVVGSGRG